MPARPWGFGALRQSTGSASDIGKGTLSLSSGGAKHDPKYDFWAHPLSNQYWEHFEKIDIFQKAAESVSPPPAMV
jgi:hypothetical protein